ncbi:MAG: hypothetical protein DDT31_00303 [Syntrophomonadaceae bacterium]|nr:hypothetical protein [Bacillota bacterium]
MFRAKPLLFSHFGFLLPSFFAVLFAISARLLFVKNNVLVVDNTGNIKTKLFGRTIWGKAFKNSFLQQLKHFPMTPGKCNYFSALHTHSVKYVPGLQRMFSLNRYLRKEVMTEQTLACS